ncbi:hypothetical protein PG997_015202 [Apiospora hydei]|uniref:Kinetochore protein Spc24 n=1 Tax=Apiospora hydei TaxID=1337664 RepID=A0ABR1UVZ9_9PEZI
MADLPELPQEVSQALQNILQQARQGLQQRRDRLQQADQRFQQMDQQMQETAGPLPQKDPLILENIGQAQQRAQLLLEERRQVLLNQSQIVTYQQDCEKEYTDFEKSIMGWIESVQRQMAEQKPPQQPLPAMPAFLSDIPDVISFPDYCARLTPIYMKDTIAIGKLAATEDGWGARGRVNLGLMISTKSRSNVGAMEWELR